MDGLESKEQFANLIRTMLDEVVPHERVDLFIFDDRDRRQWFRQRCLEWLARWEKTAS